MESQDGTSSSGLQPPSSREHETKRQSCTTGEPLSHHIASTCSASPTPSLAILEPLSPLPTTTRLRALVSGVESSEDQREGNAQIFPEHYQTLQVQQLGLDDSRGKILAAMDSRRAGVPPSTVWGALEVQCISSISRHGRISSVVGSHPSDIFFPTISEGSGCEHFPAALACSTNPQPRCLTPAAQVLERHTVNVTPTKKPERHYANFNLPNLQGCGAHGVMLGSRGERSPICPTVEGIIDQYFHLKRGRQVNAPRFLTIEPLVERIRNTPLPLGWSTPDFPRFDGEGDPDLHLLEFRTLMMPNDSEDQLARIFKQSLKGKALQWYARLEPNSIDSFKALAREFICQYSFNRAQLKQLDSLFDIKMDNRETLKAFVIRFKSEVIEIEGAAQNEEIVCRAFRRALIEGHPLGEDLLLKPVHCLDDLYRLADRRIRVEADTSCLKRTTRAVEDNAQGSKLPKRGATSMAHLEFRVSHEEILKAIINEPFFRFPDPTGVNLERADSRRFCPYHNANGHRIRNCRDFKVLLDELVSEGHLKEFI